jgi:5-methylcytosine-specific restriction enzyme A
MWAKKHKARQNQQRQHTADNRSKRTYSLNGSFWRRLRLVVLAEEPFCRVCMSANIVCMGGEVDHIDGDPNNNDRSNLQNICKAEHSRKTAKENGGFGNSKR